jgi:photosystem II stability/assembly factor-like uncharacterized protein
MKYPTHLLLPVFMLLSSCLTAQWVSMEGPFGGDVNHLKANEKFVFASTCNGIFRSADSGQSWERINVGLPETPFCAYRLIVLGDTLMTYASTYINGIYNKMLYISDDNGLNWTLIPVPDPNLTYWDVYGNKAVIIIETNNSRLKTYDRGLHWTDAQIPGSIIPALGPETSKLYATNDSIIYVSEDNAESWTELCKINLGEQYFITHLFIEDSLLFTHYYFGKTYRSADLGASWAPVVDQDYIYPFLRLAGSLFGRIGYSGEILRSDDEGITWYSTSTISNPLKFAGMTAFGQSILLNSTYALGVFRSDDYGQTVDYANHGILSSSSRMKIYGDTMYAFSPTFLFKTDLENIDWDGLPLRTDYNWDDFDFFKVGEALFILNSQEGLLRSTNYGTSWEPLMMDPSIVFDAASSGEEDIFIKRTNIGDTLLYHSADLGDTWSEIGSTILNQVGQVAQDIFVFNGAWFINTKNGCFKSTDKGANWVDYSQGLFPLPMDQEVWQSKFYSTGDFLALFTKSVTSFGFFDKTELWIRHKDSLEWKAMVHGLPALPELWLSFPEISFAQAGSTLLMNLSTEGVFKSMDGGDNWQKQEDCPPLLDPSFGYSQIASSSKYVCLSVYNRGIWQRPIEEFTVGAKEVAIAEPFAFQIQPNPVSKQALISLENPAQNPMEIKIYGINGHLVWTGIIPAGSSTLTLEMGSFPSGIYLCYAINEVGAFAPVKFVVQH